MVTGVLDRRGEELPRRYRFCVTYNSNALAQPVSWRIAQLEVGQALWRLEKGSKYSFRVFWVLNSLTDTAAQTCGPFVWRCSSCRRGSRQQTPPLPRQRWLQDWRHVVSTAASPSDGEEGKTEETLLVMDKTKYFTDIYIHTFTLSKHVHQYTKTQTRTCRHKHTHTLRSTSTH